MTAPKIVRSSFVFLFVKSGMDALTIYPRIFVRKSVNLTDDLYVHEVVHLNRQYQMGVWKWLWRYVTNKAFRYNEELISYASQLAYIAGEKSRTSPIPVMGAETSTFAAYLSTAYSTSVSYEKALEDLKDRYIIICGQVNPFTQPFNTLQERILNYAIKL